ncbi:hypothetical protein BRPE64_ACDS02690 [Caballeronia insecticola]|uniref:Uncharacterized protein n=1 Tax=Caballeronia insecticola TaxID=758793 RepID=R4WEV9_9BURK|nr:hypothetical protein BRPE64_ACDS02690 [Caballeronia insecticola]
MTIHRQNRALTESAVTGIQSLFHFGKAFSELLRVDSLFLSARINLSSKFKESSHRIPPTRYIEASIGLILWNAKYPHFILRSRHRENHG